MQDVPSQKPERQLILQSAIDTLTDVETHFRRRAPLPDKNSIKEAVEVCVQFLATTKYDGSTGFNQMPIKFSNLLRSKQIAIDETNISILADLVNQSISTDDTLALYVKLNRELVKETDFKQTIKKLKT